MLVEKWLDAGRADKPIDPRTDRIIGEFERDGYRHSETKVDSMGHRQMRFLKHVRDRLQHSEEGGDGDSETR
jgi:hypothetical protein